MKYQINLSSAEFAHSTVSVNTGIKPQKVDACSEARYSLAPTIGVNVP